MGGRQNNKDPSIAVVGSSIMLLQERFKQLQRLKEMREETQQMLRQMPQAEAHPPSSSNIQTNYDQHPLSLGLHSNSHHAPNFRPQHFPAVHNFFETPDVDTSLRL